MTKLLPIKIVLIIFSFFAKIFSTVIAFLFPCRASSWILASETAVKAVSELEKKADKIINNKILVELLFISLIDFKLSSNSFKDIDFSELCITSSAIVEKSSSSEITVITNKAEGEKCTVCWKINKNGCERHPN